MMTCFSCFSSSAPRDSADGSSQATSLPADAAREEFSTLDAKCMEQEQEQSSTGEASVQASPSSTSTPRFSLQQQLAALQQQIKEEQAQYPWNPKAALDSSVPSRAASADSPASHTKPRKAASRLSMESRLADLTAVGHARDARYRGVQRSKSVSRQVGMPEMWGISSTSVQPRLSSYTPQSHPKTVPEDTKPRDTSPVPASDRFRRHSMAVRASQHADASSNPRLPHLSPRAMGSVRATLRLPPAPTVDTKVKHEQQQHMQQEHMQQGHMHATDMQAF